LILLFQGGLKGVVLADVFQVLVMAGSMLTILTYGVTRVGGLGKVYDTCSKHGRAHVFE
jgi:Na+/proline symporter